MSSVVALHKKRSHYLKNDNSGQSRATFVFFSGTPRGGDMSKLWVSDCALNPVVIDIISMCNCMLPSNYILSTDVTISVFGK